MSIGYACIVIGENNTKISHCTLKNANNDKLREIIINNLSALDAIIDYNIKNNIKLFRISSDIIPFASHEVNKLNWQEEFREELLFIGEKIKCSNMRVSMHPGQYTVLNSHDEAIVNRAILDLEYHCDFLDSLLLGRSCKIILHIGGVYNDKANSILRFINNCNLLSQRIKNRLVLENDDTSYTIEEVINISKIVNLPVVFDNLHNLLNPSFQELSQYEWIKICSYTWKENDGTAKIHYSQTSQMAKKGSHSNSINAKEFLLFYNNLLDKEIDIMLEVKNKNLSAVKCINITEQDLKISSLEEQWARYKYFVLSKDVAIYNQIRKLLRDKICVDALAFYELIETAQSVEGSVGAQVNAAQHIWGYMSDKVKKIEKNRFFKLLTDFISGSVKITVLKNHLLKCSVTQNIEYLINSYYFYI